MSATYNHYHAKVAYYRVNDGAHDKFIVLHHGGVVPPTGTFDAQAVQAALTTLPAAAEKIASTPGEWPRKPGLYVCTLVTVGDANTQWCFLGGKHASVMETAKIHNGTWLGDDET